MTQQEQSDSRIRELGQGAQKLLGFGNASGSVSPTMSLRAHRTAEKLEVAIPLRLQVAWESRST